MNKKNDRPTNEHRMANRSKNDAKPELKNQQFKHLQRKEINMIQSTHAAPNLLQDMLKQQPTWMSGHFYNPPQAGLDIAPVSDLGLMLQALKAPARPALTGAPMRTILATVLDDSGSMDLGCDQTIEGYNMQMQTLKAKGREIGCEVLQVIFSSAPRVMSNFVKPEQVVMLSRINYRPSGGTALYDTVASTVKKLLSHPHAHDDNTSVMLTIMTDGDDQGSSVWNQRELHDFRALMKAVNANDRWTVALSGPDIKLRKFADEMCVDRDNIAAFTPASVQSRVMAMASGTQAMGNFMSIRATGLKKCDMLYAGTAAGAMAKSIIDGDLKP